MKSTPSTSQRRRSEFQEDALLDQGELMASEEREQQGEERASRASATAAKNNIANHPKTREVLQGKGGSKISSPKLFAMMEGGGPTTFQLDQALTEEVSRQVAPFIPSLLNFSARCISLLVLRSCSLRFFLAPFSRQLP
jgi:hypothetical protein